MSTDKKHRAAELRHMLEVAQLAIPKEREARALYLKAAAKAPGETARLLFEHLANEEQRHEAKLQAIIKELREQLEELLQEK